MKHIVMWRVKGIDSAERRLNAAKIKAIFESMRGKVPGMSTLEIGIDDSSADYACDLVLYSEFESRAALIAYANHPEHLSAKKLIGDIRTERYQVDYLP
jgi:hypothetical protein